MEFLCYSFDISTLLLEPIADRGHQWSPAGGRGRRSSKDEKLFHASSC